MNILKMILLVILVLVMGLFYMVANESVDVYIWHYFDDLRHVTYESLSNYLLTLGFKKLNQFYSKSTG